MGNIAYSLTADLEGEVEVFDTVEDEKNGHGRVVPKFTGGVIHAGDRDFDVAEELEKGGGIIVVREGDVALVGALDGYAALKRVPVPDDAPIADGYDDHPAKALKDELTRRGIVGHGSSAKPALVAALQRIDELSGQGENVPADTSITDLMAEPDPGDAGQDDNQGS